MFWIYLRLNKKKLRTGSRSTASHSTVELFGEEIARIGGHWVIFNDAHPIADIVAVDVQCDYHKETVGDVRKGHADIEALEQSLQIIGDKIRKT